MAVSEFERLLDINFSSNVRVRVTETVYLVIRYCCCFAENGKEM